MAIATKTPDRTEVIPGNVALVVSNEEAETLLAICSRIGGCPWTSPRADMDRISKALRQAGVIDIEANVNVDSTMSCIYFKEA